MIELLAILALGFFLGMRHATDPDHVVAVTTIVTRHRSMRQAAWIGGLWGLGHTLTILAVGSVIIIFSLVIPPRIGLTMELAVGVMLIVLGVLNLTGALTAITEALTPRSAKVHSHVHTHGDYVHKHVHTHEPDFHPHPQDQTPMASLDRSLGGLGLYQLVRPLVVGVVHGLAGSAAVALLVLTTIRDTRWAVAYLLIFGIGTIAGMALITTALASSFHFAGKHSPRFSRALATASGVLSLAFGLFIAYQIGIVDGLFTAHPHWIPR